MDYIGRAMQQMSRLEYENESWKQVSCPPRSVDLPSALSARRSARPLTRLWRLLSRLSRHSTTPRQGLCQTLSARGKRKAVESGRRRSRMRGGVA